MKILILNWKDLKHPEVGGAEIIVYELAKRFARDGYDVTWFCRSYKGAIDKEIYDDIKVIRKGNIATMIPHAFLYYNRLLEKPDIVIDMSNTVYWQTPLWARPSKRVAYLNQLAQEVFDYEYNKLLATLGKLFEKIQYLSYKNTKFICYSKSTKNDLVLMGVKEKNIDTFPMGLDLERYTKGKKSNDPLFCCISRLVKMKRTDLAIKAFRIVSDKYPSAKLCIMGYGYERIRLESLRDELNLENNVVFEDEDILFFEKDTKDKKIDLMQRSWALIFPSVKEGWGMTVTESGACGTTSIVTDVTGLRDSVVKDKTGLVLSENPSEEELASAIIKLIEDKKLRDKLSKNAYKYAHTFDWESSYEEFNKIINSL